MNKLSLHIGINNYPGTENDLTGCVNDANDWKKALEARGFQPAMLLDKQATKANMVAAFKKIVSDTGKNDIAVITYSGHGTWTPDDDGDEVDGRDEALCPYDITEGNILTDDEMYDIFCTRERGARIILVSDSCHSGTVAKTSNFTFEPEASKPAVQTIRYLAPEFYIGKDNTKMLRAKQAEKIKAGGKIREAVVLLAGCKDEEYSYDASFNGRANGAFTYIALKALKELPENATYKAWYKEIRKFLPHVRYPQTPQLCGSYEQRNKWKVFQ